MRISSRLHISTLFSILAVFVALAVILLTFDQVNKVNEEGMKADEIVRGIFELNILTNEYLLYHEKRSQTQWRLKHDSLSNIISTLDLRNPEKQSILNNIKESHESMKSLFSQLLSIYKRRITKTKSFIYKQLEERLVSQILVKSQEMISDAFQLTRKNREKFMVFQKRADLIIMALFLTLSAIIAANFFLIGRSIVKPVVKLYEDTEVIGTGNFDYKVDTEAKDEIGQLSRAFDRITKNLKEMTASRNELNKEVAERKRAEEELSKAKQRAEEASRVKSDFLANMSHELRTPLNAIIGFSEILGNKTFGDLTKKQGKYTDNILTSGRHLLQLINDILDLSKVESGKMELECNKMSIGDLFDNSLIMIKEKAMRHGIRVDRQIPEELSGVEINADERKLKQIMFNLLSNAVKFTPENGSITLAAKLLPSYSVIGLERPGEQTIVQSPIPYNQGYFLEISFTDTGIGIKPDDQERIFGEFEQLDSSFARKEKEEGTGLGLALTKKLVELHGGRIWVESEGEGKGSTFTFMIPIEAPDIKWKDVRREDEKREKPLEWEAEGPLVLVVEDDTQASELIVQYLTHEGYSVAQAFDGEEAVKMAMELRPCVITLDILLPKKDGWDVLNELKSCPETRDIPVIVISITENRKLGFSMGAIEWFVKPVEKETLFQVLRTVRTATGKECETILVVDDEPKNVEMLTDVLGAQGYNILQAYGGKQGIELAIQKLPDVIILDLLMPQVNGFEVVDQVREHPKARNIPIFIYTSKDLTQEDREKLNSQVEAIASKSTDKKSFLEELERIAKKNSPV